MIPTLKVSGRYPAHHVTDKDGSTSRPWIGGAGFDLDHKCDQTWKLNYAITDIILLHTTDKEVRTSKEKGVKGMCLDIVQPICRAAGQLPNASTCSWC